MSVRHLELQLRPSYTLIQATHKALLLEKCSITWFKHYDKYLLVILVHRSGFWPGSPPLADFISFLIPVTLIWVFIVVNRFFYRPFLVLMATQNALQTQADMHIHSYTGLRGHCTVHSVCSARVCNHSHAFTQGTRRLQERGFSHRLFDE